MPGTQEAFDKYLLTDWLIQQEGIKLMEEGKPIRKNYPKNDMLDSPNVFILNYGSFVKTANIANAWKM